MHPGPYNYPPPGAYGPGPYGRNVPRYGHPGGGSRRGGCSCLKMYCCCCCFLFLTLVLILASAVAAYFIIDPKMPKFSIDGFESKSFGFTDDGGLKSEMQVTVKAENPNKYLEFVFGEAKEPKDNSFQILYNNLTISSGTLPVFTLAKKNTTTIKMDVKGELKKDSFAQGAGESLADKLKNNDKVPLQTIAMVPIKFKLSGYEIAKGTRFVVNVNTAMNVANLAQGKDLGISDTKSEITFYVNKHYFKLNGKNNFF